MQVQVTNGDARRRRPSLVPCAGENEEQSPLRLNTMRRRHDEVR